MNIYYLYIKTHTKTGLKYLGKTIRNPYTYNGSGLHWCRHLNKHGTDVETQILKKCYSKKSLKAWGLFYCKLWSIVRSKKWANIRDESGDGGDTSQTPNYVNKRHLFGTNPVYGVNHAGKNNPNYDPSLYQFKHKDGRTELCTRIEMFAKYGLPSNKIGEIIKNPGSTYHGWYTGEFPKERVRGKNVHTYDKTIYNFVHDSGISEHLTRYDLMQKYSGLSPKGMHCVCRNNKSHQGWSIK